MHPDPNIGHGRPATSSSRAGEQGSVLIWALFFVCLTTGILIAHSLEMSANRKTMDTRYRRVDLANTIAESALIDATAYLRRQPTQPVVQFAPQRDETADPPVLDTIDPAIGLVREFEVSGNLWGRYEIRRDEARDVSAQYGEPAGTVWDVGARGYLYEVVDKALPFDRAPNRVLSRQTIYTELRGVAMNLPASSAVIVDDPAQIEMLGNGLVDGKGGPAVAYRKPALPLPLPVLDISITGLPTSISVLGLDLQLASLFGMREDRLLNLADLVVVSPRQLRGRELDDEIVFVQGNLDLDPSTVTLRGRALLLVDGDLTAAPNNNSDFRGVAFVRGNVVIEGPFSFSGTMIAGGAVKFGGSTDLVRIQASPTDVAALQQSLAQYRVSKSKRPAATNGAYATPADLTSTVR